MNSNPATIMTDPELAFRTYVEPLEPKTLEAIIERERPDAILPTLGGQTALNLALALNERGVLAKYGVEMLGAKPGVDREGRGSLALQGGDGEDRPHVPARRQRALRRGGVGDRRRTRASRPSCVRRSRWAARAAASRRTRASSRRRWRGRSRSPPRARCLIEESVLGWKEFELEVIRDKADNFIVVCSIENIDPMGVHTGDSITVAPAMTLTDKEYQRLRDAAKAVMTEIGVETGGSNVQFAVSPNDGTVHVIEMNPRVSRSSALASKATGYPIAKIAAKLAVGYTLDELKNDITGTSAAFEPVIDYVVVKWPRFAFEKFPGADNTLGTQMKSVGEAMSIGRTFCEALQKAARSLETSRDGLVSLVSRVDYRAARGARRSSAI